MPVAFISDMQKTAVATVPARPGRQPRVLLVDSDVLLLWSIVETLPAADYAVMSVNDAEQAAMAVAETDYDVIVMADTLPDFGGLTLLSALRRLAPSARVLILASDVNCEFVEAAVTLGATAVLEKPVALPLLAAAIARAADPATGNQPPPEVRRSDARSRYTHSTYGAFHDSRRRR